MKISECSDSNCVALLKVLGAQMNASAKSTRIYLNNVISCALLLEESEDDQTRELAAKILDAGSRALARNINLEYYSSEELYANCSDVLNAVETVESLIKQCQKILALKNRKIDFQIECASDVGIRIEEKTFAVVFMNLIQNALLYSPKDSAVSVSLGLISRYVAVTIENFIAQNRDDRDDFSENIEERAGLGIPLSTKIIERHNGKLSLAFNGNKAVATLSLPLAVCDRKLKTLRPEYISERFKPVNLFLDEI